MRTSDPMGIAFPLSRAHGGLSPCSHPGGVEAWRGDHSKPSVFHGDLWGSSFVWGQRTGHTPHTGHPHSPFPTHHTSHHTLTLEGPWPGAPPGCSGPAGGLRPAVCSWRALRVRVGDRWVTGSLLRSGGAWRGEVGGGCDDAVPVPLRSGNPAFKKLRKRP